MNSNAARTFVRCHTQIQANDRLCFEIENACLWKCLSEQGLDGKFSTQSNGEKGNILDHQAFKGSFSLKPSQTIKSQVRMSSESSDPPDSYCSRIKINYEHIAEPDAYRHRCLAEGPTEKWEYWQCCHMEVRLGIQERPGQHSISEEMVCPPARHDQVLL